MATRAPRAALTALDAAAGALAAAGAARQARAAQATAPVLSASDRENPDKLAGEDLRALAHRRGVSRSEAATMSDDKLRMQLRYITNRQYADEAT